MAESGRRIVAIEVKASSTVSREDLKHLDRFATQGPGRTRTVTSILLYLGSEPLVLGERTFALPVSVLWAPWEGRSTARRAPMPTEADEPFGALRGGVVREGDIVMPLDETWDAGR